MDIFIQQVINGLIQGSLYALVALGYTMVYGILGLINFAHGDVVMVGALVTYTVFIVAKAYGLVGWMACIIALIAALAVCVPLGLILDRVAYRPLRKAARLAPLITAIGASILIQYLSALIWTKGYLTLPTLIEPSLIEWGNVSTSDLQLGIFFLSVILMIGLLYLIQYTLLGKAMRAVAQNHELASLMGINVERVIGITFILGAALAAVAGLMLMLYYGIGHYLMGSILGLKAFTGAVLGGIGSIPGAMLGGLLLGVIENLGAGYIGDVTGGLLGSNYRDIFAFLVLITVLIFKPSGLLGRASGDRA